MEASGAKNMDELMAISGDEWMKLDGEKGIADQCCYVVVDGDIIPEDLDKAIEDAAKAGTQLIVGGNDDERNYFMDDSEGETEKEKFATWVEDIDRMYKSTVHAVEYVYLLNNLEDGAYSGETDSGARLRKSKIWEQPYQIPESRYPRLQLG